MERTIAPRVLKADMAHKLILDVRRAADHEASTEQIPGATWHDPERQAEWAGQLSHEAEIVIYCVRGGSVSNSLVDALQSRGLKVRFIEGGIEGWKAAGGEVTAK